MKIVKKGKGDTPWAGKKIICPNCESVIKLEENDKLQFVPDQRDGDYYQFNCPACSVNVTVDAKIINSR